MGKHIRQKGWESIINATTGDTIKSLSDFMGVYYNVIDTEGNFIVKNETFSSDFPMLENNCLKATDAWKDCVEVMKSGKRKIVQEEFNGRFIMSIKQPVYDNGKCVGISIISHDITSQKKADIAKRDFINTISHDIRTPFVAIRYIIEALARDEKDPDRKEKLRMVSTSSEYLLQFLEKIISFVSSSNYQGKEEFNIRESLKGVIQMIQPILKDKEIDVELKCPSKKIFCSKLDFEQISLNLLTNAIKFTEKGKVSVVAKLKKKGEGVGLNLLFIDTGIGIEKEYQEQIFEKHFQRVTPSYLEPRFNGTGLGLSIVKNNLRNMQGSITVESEVGKGSTFNVNIPA